ncbi:hypothetical protein BS78_06G097500 [Paspalum vaginatum]|nr:hypothetical protein BS78_06G097500 [Paspalum vaginatum]
MADPHTWSEAAVRLRAATAVPRVSPSLRRRGLPAPLTAVPPPPRALAPSSPGGSPSPPARALACGHCHPAPPHLRPHAMPLSPSPPLSRRRPREARFPSLADGRRSIRPPAVGVRASRSSSK